VAVAEVPAGYGAASQPLMENAAETDASEEGVRKYEEGKFRFNRFLAVNLNLSAAQAD
jgi:hypothetical protein